jgi:hypothetical protein
VPFLLGWGAMFVSIGALIVFFAILTFRSAYTKEWNPLTKKRNPFDPKWQVRRSGKDRRAVSLRDTVPGSRDPFKHRFKERWWY